MIKMYTLLFISLFIFSFACSKKENSPAELKPDQTIIPVQEKMEWAFGRNYKPYSPSSEDIQTAEDLLLQCFNKEVTGTGSPFSGRKLEDYNRQFVGAELEGGSKVIWINCFCKSEVEVFRNWKTDILMVADGGNCFFKLKINLKTKEYYDLMVNGFP